MESGAEATRAVRRVLRGLETYGFQMDSVALRLGVSVRTVAEWISGDKHPRLEQFQNLKAKLDELRGLR